MSSSRLLSACRVSRRRALINASTPSCFYSQKPKFTPLSKDNLNVSKVTGTPNRQTFTLLAMLLATTMCGAVGGFSIAQSVDTPPTENTKAPKYGTVEDFKQAIKELQEALPRDGGVSTDPADLVIHGESPYHHHDGTQTCSLQIFSLKYDQAYLIVSLSIRKAPKMSSKL